MQWGDRPVILAGNGLRAAGPEVASRLLALGVPVLSSWQAADLFDNWDWRYFGRPGIYGQRAANKIMVEADHVIAVGNRLSIWNVGYEGIKQRLTMIDVDEYECKNRYPQAELIVQDAGEWVKGQSLHENEAWLTKCLTWVTQWLEPCHAHGKYLNSYQCIYDIGKAMAHDAVVVTDMGAAICGAYQVMRFRPPQICLTSGGLGEMGCGLPYAVGAAFATGRPVVALLTDGGMMLNLQELQTIAHHNLPVKMFIFDNRGYSMIRHTQKNLGYPYRGTDKASGVSMPDFADVGMSFGFPAWNVSMEEQWREALLTVLRHDGPIVCVVHIDAEQRFWPKLEPIMENGVIRSPKFDELSPLCLT